MAIDFPTFLTQLSDAILSENGDGLAYLLRPTSPHGKDLVKAHRNPNHATFNRYLGSIVSPWDEIAIQYVLTCTHVAKRRSIDAFKEHSKLVTLFLNWFVTKSGWTLLALFSILRDLRDLAHDADMYAKFNNLKAESMEEAARIIAKAFSNCLSDRVSSPQNSRKWGVYYVVGLILKSYFRIRRISLSKNILRALEANSDVPPLQMFPRSHQVTYRYYIGMLSFLNEQYTKAEQELTLAFYNCLLDAHSNQERILTYLIPLRMLKGHLPSRELLSRFPGLDALFAPFVTAIRQGDVSSFDSALERWEHRLVELNLFITLEKSRDLCIRGLFRRVWVAADSGTRIPIAMFHSGLKLAGVDVPSEEAECLVANMIYKGFLKGYISHEQQMVVIAKTDAFPRPVDRPDPYSLP